MDAATLSLIAEPRRREILRMLWAQELSAGQIARQFRVTFGAISQHLGRLWRAGLLKRRRAGKQVFYVADRAALGPLAAGLEAMWADRLTVLKSLAEAEQHSSSPSAGRSTPEEPR